MKASKLLIVTLGSLFLMSCGSGADADKALGTDGVQARGKQIVNATANELEVVSPSGITWGRIFTDTRWGGDNQELFKEKLVDFLSPQLKAENVGVVSGDLNNTETGVQFWGRGITLNTGADFSLSERPLRTEDAFKVETAELRISIIHKNPAAEDFEEIPIHFNSGLQESKGRLIYSEREGSYIQLIFADSFGKVSLSGILEEGISSDGVATTYYTGQLLYRNLKDINGEAVSHEAKVLGQFKVKACGFFKCAN